MCEINKKNRIPTPVFITVSGFNTSGEKRTTMAPPSDDDDLAPQLVGDVAAAVVVSSAPPLHANNASASYAKLPTFTGVVPVGEFDAGTAAWFNCYESELELEQQLSGRSWPEPAKVLFMRRFLAGPALSWFSSQWRELKELSLDEVDRRFKQDFRCSLSRPELMRHLSDVVMRPDETYRDFAHCLVEAVARWGREGHTPGTHKMALQTFIDYWPMYRSQLSLATMVERDANPAAAIWKAVNALTELAFSDGRGCRRRSLRWRRSILGGTSGACECCMDSGIVLMLLLCLSPQVDSSRSVCLDEQ